ncbi:MAG: SRPBCC family protein [Vicinamibacterales bacterium]
MPTVTQTVDISAPVDRVYSFLADRPEAATSFIPGLNRISNISPPKAEVGQTWEYEFNWFGLVISGQTRCTKLDRPRSYQFQTVTGNRSTWTYGFEPRGAATHVTLEVEYDLPQNMLARYASQGALDKMNQDRAAEALSNLKGLLEE